MKNTLKLIGFYMNLLALVAPRYAARKGFYLFCTPVAPPVKPHHKQFFETSEMTRVTYDGTSLRLYRWGQGPKTILLIHGWQSHSFRWKNYIEALSPGEYTVYAFDAPAHGLSGGKYINIPVYSRAIEAVIEQIGPVHAIVSHSFGSFSSLYALAHRPELPIEKLVITGTPGEGMDFINFYRQLLGLNDRTMQLIRYYFVKELGQEPEYFSAMRFAEKVQLPGLIIHDEQDEETPYRYAKLIHDRWKNSILITTRGLGHNLKSPDVVKYVTEFVGSTVGEAVSH